MAFMNRRDYESALSLLEAEHAAHPDDKRITVLLAQANLGVVRLEMLELADHVMSGRSKGIDVELMFRPECVPGPIKSVHESDARCILFRILRELPLADDPHVLRARDLIRGAFPDPKVTPTEINFLGAFVELSSGLARVKAFLAQGAYQAVTDRKFSFIIHQAKGLFDEIQQGFKRARYSYGKVSKFVATLDGRPLIEIGHQKLVFSEEIGIPALLRFVAAVSGESREQIDAALNDSAAGALGNLGSGFVEALRSLDFAAFGGQGGTSLRTSLLFEAAINRALNQVAGSLDRGEPVNVFDVVWTNPPRIFNHLSSAVKKTWETEQPVHLRRYFAETQSEWDELESLRYGWDRWVNNSLRPSQREGFGEYLRLRHELDPRLGPLPAQLTTESLRRWQAGFVTAAKQSFDLALNGSDPSAPALDAAQAAEARGLLDRSLAWVGRNLWVGQ